MRVSMPFCLAVLLVSPASGFQPPDSAAAAFIRSARSAAARYEMQEQAIRDGFVRVGPDFPGMGEHWVQPGRIVAGRLDPARPPVLSYTTREGRPVLLGMAWALPLGPGEEPPGRPFRPDVWHDHSNAVDEEVLLIGGAHDGAHPSSGARLLMVHVWTGVPNPDGILAQNNWALPWWRNGLPVPESVSRTAARGLSLAYDGRLFYRALLDRAVDLSPGTREAVERRLDAHATRAEALIAAYRSDPAVRASAEAEAIWLGLWGEVQAIVPAAQWERLARFAEGR